MGFWASIFQSSSCVCVGKTWPGKGLVFLRPIQTKTQTWKQRFSACRHELGLSADVLLQQVFRGDNDIPASESSLPEASLPNLVSHLSPCRRQSNEYLWDWISRISPSARSGWRIQDQVCCWLYPSTLNHLAWLYISEVDELGILKFHFWKFFGRNYLTD